MHPCFSSCSSSSSRPPCLFFAGFFTDLSESDEPALFRAARVLMGETGGEHACGRDVDMAVVATTVVVAEVCIVDGSIATTLIIIGFVSITKNGLIDEIFAK
ncbi:hypothetical protein JOM56_011571 [Amanita muscaria]